MCGRRDWINIPRNIVLAAKQLETRWSSGRKSDANNIEILYLGNTQGRFVLSAIARCFFWPPYMKGRAFSWERAVDLLRPGWGLELITYLCLQMDGWGGISIPHGRGPAGSSHYLRGGQGSARERGSVGGGAVFSRHKWDMGGKVLACKEFGNKIPHNCSCHNCHLHNSPRRQHCCFRDSECCNLMLTFINWLNQNVWIVIFATNLEWKRKSLPLISLSAWVAIIKIFHWELLIQQVHLKHHCAICQNSWNADVRWKIQQVKLAAQCSMEYFAFSWCSI